MDTKAAVNGFGHRSLNNKRLRTDRNHWCSGDDRKIKVIIILEQKPEVITYGGF